MGLRDWRIWSNINSIEPVQNAIVESFIGRFRDECLNQHWFGSLAEAREIIKTWRQHYNRGRPHSALDYEPPEC